MSDNADLQSYRERFQEFSDAQGGAHDHIALMGFFMEIRPHVEQAQKAQVETMKRFEEVRGSGPSIVPITPEMIAARTEAVNVHSAAVDTAREWSDLHVEVRACMQNCERLILGNPAGHG